MLLGDSGVLKRWLPFFICIFRGVVLGGKEVFCELSLDLFVDDLFILLYEGSIRIEVRKYSETYRFERNEIGM
jgi:hypothetical protein